MPEPEPQTELQQSVPWLHEEPDCPQVLEHWNTLLSQLLPLQQSLSVLQLLPSTVQLEPELVELVVGPTAPPVPIPMPLGTQMPPSHVAFATHVWPLSQRPSISTRPPAGATHVPPTQLSLAHTPLLLPLGLGATTTDLVTGVSVKVPNKALMGSGAALLVVGVGAIVGGSVLFRSGATQMTIEPSGAAAPAGDAPAPAKAARITPRYWLGEF